MSVLVITSMNKILAISPKSVEKYTDWLKIASRIGQASGVFFADYPKKKWIIDFNSRLSTLGIENWDDWDQKKIQEFFISLKNHNSLISLESPYLNKSWESNYLEINSEKKNKCVAIGSRNNPEGIQDFDKFDPTEIFVEDTVEKKFKPIELVDLLKDYFLHTGKIAIVDRNCYLTTPNGQISEFAKFIQEILKLNSDRLGQIIIYTKHDPEKYDFLKSIDSLNQTLRDIFSGFKSPCWGIKYISCIEAGAEMDLHRRMIVTNHSLFLLSDSIPGFNKSQSITRVQSQTAREKAISLWIDEKVEIEKVFESSFHNMIKN